jgi:iron-sulfur cluster assembly protein
MFTLTSAAAQQIQLAAQASSAETWPCVSRQNSMRWQPVQYGMGFDEPDDEDLKLNLEGVSIVIGMPYQALLEDTTLDLSNWSRVNSTSFFWMAKAEGGVTTAVAASGGCGSGGCGSKGGGCH